MIGIRSNELLQWHIPLDIADLYGEFLSSTSYDDHKQFICNCSTSNTFGRYCEYSFKKDINTIEELIISTIKEKKTFYPKDRLLTCYDLENNTDRCLDYRDICDGELDTMNGDDELYCDQIETNICDENEFRCRNGFCIDRQFLFDGQGDCTDLTDEQTLLIIKKYHNFQNYYEQATIDCDEHWCGREMISCGDGECILWNRRFWSGYDCSNSYTHLYNCELEERSDKIINYSITDNNGRCTMNITEFNDNNDQCLSMIKCAVTLHSSCKSINMFFAEGEDAYTYTYQLCRNRTLIDYALGATFLSPFVRAYHVPKQFEKYTSDFFSKIKVRQPNRFCLIGERMCRGIQVIHNGSKCYPYDDIFERNYPFPPYDHFFCQSINYSVNYCVNTTFFYRCQTSGECISKYRLFDGFVDCFDASDEHDLEALNSLSPLFIRDRYNCTINVNSSNTVMRHFLGDGTNVCFNGADEMSLSINWQEQQCFKSDDFACSLLRDLNNSNNEEQSTHILPFTNLCDSFWNLRNGSDEIDCDEWICEPGWIKQQSNLSRWSGNCINPQWKCNRIWDYTDGSDEYNCNRTEPYPIPDCLLLETNEIISLNVTNTIAGNGIVECSGGIDERVTFACNDGFPLNERFLCNDKITCLKPMYLCNHVIDCSTGEDESEFWCGQRPSLNTPACDKKRLACLERDDYGPCIPQEDRCHTERTSCLSSHQDDYMCIHPRKYNHIILKPFTSPEMQDPQSNVIPPWYCDRGLVVYRYDKLECLCPPSYFGHRCEKHSHRLTVIFTLNINIIKADLIRIIVLLINHNVTIDHVLITQEPSYTGKHRLYLNYPYFLYSNLRETFNNYIVQIRVYTVGHNLVRLLFVSQYLIKYSFLPAFRIAVVLRDKDNLLLRDQSYRSDSYDFILNGLENHDRQSPLICSCASNNWHNETDALSTTRILQLINYDIMKMHLKIERQHLFLKESDRVFYDDLHLPPIALLKVYDPVHFNIYLLYFHNNYSIIDLTEQNKTKCRHAKEFNLIPTNYSYQALLFVMKRYHRPCQQLKQENTVCFYDPQTYFCFCNATTHRSLCFSYNFKYDHCNECLNDGSCYAGEQKTDRKDFICRCAPCIYGALCEFRMDNLKYTFESLLILDLSSIDNSNKWYTAFLSISRSRFTNQTNLTRKHSRKQFIWPLFIILMIFICNGTEVIFHRLINDPRKPKHFVCTIEFPESDWRILETIFRFIMHLIPFLLNMYAVITIIRTVARSKANINKTSFLSEIWKQIKQYNEQLACPTLMIICSTPELLMALIVKCHEWDNVYRRSLMLAMHLLSFVPQMLTYYLFIQPSKTYKTTFVHNSRNEHILSTLIRTS
ncbi:unnamed protein product [Rotaria sordida]|uniref:EGF-like domain-containing protein n=1 Tax=Rotaria sordida TaxID=392033 RepID=A0A814EIF2_9BILA|nr:unnamed protein product [Rotaria sordida]